MTNATIPIKNPDALVTKAQFQVLTTQIAELACIIHGGPFIDGEQPCEKRPERTLERRKFNHVYSNLMLLKPEVTVRSSASMKVIVKKYHLTTGGTQSLRVTTKSSDITSYFARQYFNMSLNSSFPI